MDLFNRKDSSFVHHVHDSLNKNSIGSNFITSIAEDSEGILWMASSNGLLIRFDSKNMVFENIRLENSPIFMFIMPVVYVDSKDVVWFSGFSGVFRYRKSDKSY